MYRSTYAAQETCSFGFTILLWDFWHKKMLGTLFFVATSTEISYQFYDTPPFVDSICNKIGEYITHTHTHTHIYIYIFILLHRSPPIYCSSKIMAVTMGWAWFGKD